MSLTESTKNFHEIEGKVKKICNELGCKMLKEILENWDKELAKNRDREKYRHKGRRKRVIKTVLGEVEYERTVYEIRDESGSSGCVYLLDKAMGMNGSGYMSGQLSEQIVLAVCESTYRGAARSVSEMTGQMISHTAAWNVVQVLGGRIESEEQRAKELASENKGTGAYESKVLFEEQDGIHLKLQGKARKRYGTSKEMKLAIAYNGMRKTGKGRYEATNKVACANFEPAEQFQARKEGAIAAVYNVDEIETRLLSGDGAWWIKQAMTEETAHFQIDSFHRNKAIRQWIKRPDIQKEAYKLLYAKDIEGLLSFIEALSNSVEGEEYEGALALLTYFKNNKEALIPYYRLGLKISPPPNGIEYRGMGIMESNIFTILGNRMKGRRACWSIDGANNLARLLCLKAMKRLTQTLRSLTTIILPEKYAEEIYILTPKEVGQTIGKGYNGYSKSSSFPAIPSFKWLRDLGGVNPLYDE